MSSIKPIALYISLFCVLVCSCELEKQERDPENKLKKTISNKADTASKFPDIRGANHIGQSVALREIGSKYILLEFWASWCPPCRKANPGYVHVYHKYHKKGLDYFSISLDDKHEKWARAIEEDRLIWPNHICEYMGWESKWAAYYGVESIPNNVLYDQTGKIIAKELSPDQLDRILEGLLK